MNPIDLISGLLPALNPPAPEAPVETPPPAEEPLTIS